MVDIKKDESGKFAVGNAGGGRKRGARNRLHADFVVALQDHFQEFGKAAIEIVFKEKPNDYLKIIASVLPKEFILEDGRLESMGDDELAEHIAEIQRLRAEREQSASGPARIDFVAGAKTPLN